MARWAFGRSDGLVWLSDVGCLFCTVRSQTFTHTQTSHIYKLCQTSPHVHPNEYTRRLNDCPEGHTHTHTVFIDSCRWLCVCIQKERCLQCFLILILLWLCPSGEKPIMTSHIHTHTLICLSHWSSSGMGCVCAGNTRSVKLAVASSARKKVCGLQKHLRETEIKVNIVLLISSDIISYLSCAIYCNNIIQTYCLYYQKIKR